VFSSEQSDDDGGASASHRRRPAIIPVSVDFIREFALPSSAECLKSRTGVVNVRYQDMSQWMIDGIANYVAMPR
jgi:hypothetical protein